MRPCHRRMRLASVILLAGCALGALGADIKMPPGKRLPEAVITDYLNAGYTD